MYWAPWNGVWKLTYVLRHFGNEIVFDYGLVDAGNKYTLLGRAEHAASGMIRGTLPRTAGVSGRCEDVAIIGAGVAGSYTAWRLRKLGHRVTVYEFSDRVGGRMLTKHFPGIPDVNVELGAMRFLPTEHTLMNKTIHKLGLPVIDFKGKLGHLHDTMVYLRGKHLSPYDLLTDKLPYNLRPEERNLTGPQLQRKLYVEKTSYGQTNGDPVDILNITTLDGKKLYRQSDSVAHTKMSSAEAHRFLRDDSGFKSEYGQLSAAVSVPKGPQPSPWERENAIVKTIGTGMESLPKKLMDEFLTVSRRHTLRRNQQLIGIRKARGGIYWLTFRRTRTVDGFTTADRARPIRRTCAKRIVIAVPRLALETINWIGLKQEPMADYIKNALLDAKATKIYMSYTQPWWRNLRTRFSTSKSDLPNRWTYDFGTTASSKKSVMLAAYMDMEDTDYWTELRKHGQLVPGVCERAYSISADMADHAHRHLAKLHKIRRRKVPPVLGAMMSRWELYPYGAAWNMWLPGYDWNIVQNRMLRPLHTDDVYVVASAFSPDVSSAWGETALKYVELLEQKYGDRFRNIT